MYTAAVAIAMAVGEQNSARRDGVRQTDASMRVGPVEDGCFEFGRRRTGRMAVGRGGWIADGAGSGD